MTDALLEELLHEDESATLDFKRDQYPFGGATDEQKGELLKDILAFANAWRRTTAYILIGVDEVKGGRSLPVGVTVHLNDNELQQFVNSKTNRPLTFAYRAYSFQNSQIGIIEIPVQTRPTYLRKAFGKLHANTVYVRRGSSTESAEPDEIARMGAADTASAEVQPTFEMEWADLSKQTALGASVECRNVVLTPRLSADALMPRYEILGAPFYMPGIRTPDASYYQDLVTYAYDSQLLIPLGFCLRNTSGVAARSVLIKSRLEKVEGVRFHDHSDRPIKPSKHPHMAALASIQPLGEQLRQKPDPRVREFPTHWELTIPFGNVLPRSTVWSTRRVYLGSERNLALRVPIEVYAENLANPQTLELNVVISSERRAMTRADLSLAEDD